jgi:uncharacterized protein YbbC (DUF1343 family)
MSTATLTIDKLQFTKALAKRGFTQEQAEGILEAVSGIDAQHLVTKEELKDIVYTIRTDIKDMEMRTYKFIVTIALAQTALTVALIELLK